MNKSQQFALSKERFDKWLKYHKINLQPHQYKLCIAIFQLDELTFNWEPEIKGLPKINSFVGLGSGLTFALNVAEKFIKNQGNAPLKNSEDL